MEKQLTNMPASVRARLADLARKNGTPFAELLQYYAMERFLYRLSKSGHASKFVLKGALLFGVWGIPGRRTTLDIDLLAKADNSTAEIEHIVKSVCRESVPADGMLFDPSTVKGIRTQEEAEYAGVRVKFTGYLGRARVSMQMDFGFGDRMEPGPGSIEYPVILDFPVPKLKGYPAASVVSEKFETIVRLGDINSRMKDFYDIWLMMNHRDFEGEELAEAIRKTFAARGTGIPQGKRLFSEGVYTDGQDMERLWKAFVARNGITGAPKHLSSLAVKIEKFLTPPAEAAREGKKFREKWKNPGLWV